MPINIRGVLIKDGQTTKRRKNTTKNIKKSGLAFLFVDEKLGFFLLLFLNW